MSLLNRINALIAISSILCVANVKGMQYKDDLKRAVKERKIEKVRFLLSKDHAKNVADEEELTPWAFAVECAANTFTKKGNESKQKKALQILELFLQSGCQVNQFITQWNANSLEWILLKPSPSMPIVRLLVAYGGDIDDEIWALLPSNSNEVRKELQSIDRFKERIGYQAPGKITLRYLKVHSYT